MAHKKAGGSTRNGRESHSKRLGVKKFGGESVLAGNILVRQRGTTMRAGTNVGIGTDHTLFALNGRQGQVREEGRRGHTFVSVDADEAELTRTGIPVRDEETRLAAGFFVGTQSRMLHP